MTLLVKKINLAVVINNRANYARMKSFLKIANKDKKIKIYLILAASSLIDKFGELEKFIKKDGIKIYKKIFTVIAGDKPVTMAKTTALEISELANVFENSRPDYVFAIADRFETLAVAVAASYMNIPLLHLQGGEVTGTIDESVRHAISKFANVHFPATLNAKKNLIKMGEDPKTVFYVGCPSIDIAKSIKNKKSNAYNILNKYKFSNPNNLNLKDIKNYIIVVQHPVTTEYEKTSFQINQTINAISKLGIHTIWLWPNVDSGSDIISKELRKARENNKLNKTIFIKNLETEDFLKLLNNSKCIVGNSSVGIRESSYLGTPSVNIGTRQNKRERGKNTIQCDIDWREILRSIKIQVKKGRYMSSKIYGNGNSGKKILNCILKLKIRSTQKRLFYG